ncbi:hypothetical protein niasHT_014207 [Heterodera trifolii]|uniref:ATPase AAA-type core domain-containing protein n=1 Tax=Heterodera trifolii TaxID=157864 RepID=A0ABD2KX23_9BILA
MKSVILNPIHQSAEVVKKVEDCRGVIEGLASDKSIAEEIISLLQKRDEILRFKMDTTNISLEDVADSETKKALQTVMLPLQYPDRFQGFLSPQKSILLGDEIDAFLRSGTVQRGKAQFFFEMDKLSSNSVCRVLVIGAIDCPKEMDKDAIKRFAKRIFFEIPSQQTREKMIRKIIEENQNAFELRDEQIKQLASRTENYYFDDLLALCQTVNLSVLHNASEQNQLFQWETGTQLRRIKTNDLENAIEKPKLNKKETNLKKEPKSLSNKRNGKEKGESQNE